MTNLPDLSATLGYDIETRTGSVNLLYRNLACDSDNQSAGP